MKVTLPNGEAVPVYAAMSEREKADKFLPDLVKAHNGQEWVNNQPVKFVRDTASSITIVKSSLVKPEQMNDQTVRCMLAGGCLIVFKLAEVDITTPYHTGRTRAANNDSVIHELLIGNDYMEQIANEEKRVESPPQNDNDYNGPFIFENSRLNQSENRVRE